ncbi:MAG: transaldolase [Deinococcus-Thermus bacterium]|nr:transaldolase [Deinococcota bacterium]
MHLYLDTADLGEVAGVLPHPLIHGVTTNPTLMRKAGLRYDALPDFVQAASDLGAHRVHVQVRHRDVEGMLRDARAVADLAGAVEPVVKIPATREGFAAASHLASAGMAVTMTAVYEPEQVVWSLLAGATYAAPYLGRLGDAGRDGPAVVATMQRLLERYRDEIGGELRLLVASVRSREAFLELLDIGVEAVTIPTRLFDDLVEHDATREAEATFLKDAESD